MSSISPEHIAAAQTAAARVKAKTGFYCWPSVTLAQMKIESANGTKLSGKNNFFGIKATQAQIAAGKATKRTTREVINGKTEIIDAWFADYDSLADAYEAHAMLFVRVGVYASALKMSTASGFLAMMAKHYATAPNYESAILSVMHMDGLLKYDDPNGAKPVSPPIPDVPAPKPSAPSPAPAKGFWAVLVDLFLSLFKRAA